MIDCGIRKQNKQFRYRAAAIIIENESVLFASNQNDYYLYSVGGAVHMGETAHDAVLREVFEETGVHYEIDHLAVIHENFFNESNGTLKGLDCHEISFYYLMKPRGTQELHDNSYSSFGVKEKNALDTDKKLRKIQSFSKFSKRVFKRGALWH